MREEMNKQEVTQSLIESCIDNITINYGPNILRDLFDLSSLCYWAGRNNFDLDKINNYIMDKMDSYRNEK